MGICLSNQIKAQSPFHTGVISCKNVSGNGTELSNSSSKATSASIPSNPWIEDEILQSSNLKSFAFSDLKAATRNFRPDCLLGGGGFGSVYKGWVDEHSLAASKPGAGMVIAVKRLNRGGWQGHKEWLAEVNYLGQLRHPNLVKLIGYCLEDDRRLLVYEFMPKGSLENHLFRRGSYFQPLSWSLRMKIALCAARGLAFLHNADIKVIYRDFTASSILLDSNYNAKLSDLRLARDVPTGDKSNVSTRVNISTRIMEINGYTAPEFILTGCLTTKTDVYSFGVVLLEIISGKKAMDTNLPIRERNLVKWAKPYLMNKRRMLSILDPRLEGQYSTGQALKVATLVLQCLCENPQLRPKMNEVVTALEQESKDTSTYDQNSHKSNHYS